MIGESLIVNRMLDDKSIHQGDSTVTKRIKVDNIDEMLSDD